MEFEKGASSLKVDGTDERKFSVLVVDDDATVRKIHSMFLRKFPVDVQEAVNGKEAVDLYRSGAFFDLVLMDLEMPIMNGFEATKELRALGLKSLIVGVTSRSSDLEKKAFMEAGLNYCYGKPLIIETIKSLLQELNKSN